MATKTITITEGAYEKLKMRKKENESFSDVINRTMPYTDWTEFIGVLSEESARKLEESIKESRKSWSKRLDEINKKLGAP